MKTRDLMFIAIVLGVVGGLYFLSTRGRARPVPANPPEHQTAKSRDECLVCHTPQKLEALELQHRHPGKWRDARVSCFRCHSATPRTARIAPAANNHSVVATARLHDENRRLLLTSYHR